MNSALHERILRNLDAITRACAMMSGMDEVDRGGSHALDGAMNGDADVPTQAWPNFYDRPFYDRPFNDRPFYDRPFYDRPFYNRSMPD